MDLGNLHDLNTKFSVVPERLLDGIIDDALKIATQRINAYLPNGVSIDSQSVDLSAIRDALRSEVADRLSEIGAAVDQNDPRLTAIIVRYAEILKGFFQTEELQLESYIWRSRDDARVRSAHAQNDDRVFSWSDPPEGGHLGQGWNCRCTAEPIIDQASIPAGAMCDILTEDRLAPLFGYFSRNPQDALLYGRTTDQPADQEAIANRAYAHQNGKGDIESGDGWRYRGRGLKQVTGREHYRAFTKDHAQFFGELIDFESEPELLGTPLYATRSALWFWRANDLFLLADAGINGTAADSITAIINPGTDTYDQRCENDGDISATEVFSNICGFSVAKPRFEDAK